MTEPKPKPALQKQIDENLKRVYQEELEGELPERFTSLLAQLRAGDTSPKDGNT